MGVLWIELRKVEIFFQRVIGHGSYKVHTHMSLGGFLKLGSVVAISVDAVKNGQVSIILNFIPYLKVRPKYFVSIA